MKTADKRMFPGRVRCDNPEVIIKSRNRLGDSYSTEELTGKFYRVSPKCAKEVFALQMLDNQYEKFPPAYGNGVIVSAEALAKLEAKPNF